MLVHHLAQHEPRLFFEQIPAHAAPTPGQFFPHHNAQLVTRIQHRFGLRIMAETNEIETGRFDLLKLLAAPRIWHTTAASRPIFMPMGAAQQQALAVQIERATCGKIEGAEAKSFDDFIGKLALAYHLGG